MRISDWSSDVCSSDLCLETDEVWNREIPVGSTDEDFSRSECENSQKGDMKIRRNMFAEHKMPFLKPNWLENDPHSPLYWRSGDHHSTRNILIKIGRASCRERVCQYV